MYSLVTVQSITGFSKVPFLNVLWIPYLSQAIKTLYSVFFLTLSVFDYLHNWSHLWIKLYFFPLILKINDFSMLICVPLRAILGERTHDIMNINERLYCMNWLQWSWSSWRPGLTKYSISFLEKQESKDCCWYWIKGLSARDASAMTKSIVQTPGIWG